ncbi:hypothetical protein ACFOLC_00880 [Lysobacter cavernae]|uniref:Uncharacterized protein n=1 Tax=Lysobacter cavernae TaxID=1685901 RepID=A0ABV7RL99_9GAMM
MQKLIGDIAAHASDEMRSTALAELQRAITSFRQGYPHAEVKLEDRMFDSISGKEIKGGLCGRGGIAMKREALAELSESLRRSVEVLTHLPPDALSALCAKCGPIGRLARWANAAFDEYEKAKMQPDHEDDHSRAYLAYEVARVLRDTLRMRPTMGSDRRYAQSPRGGAAYARLLRGALEAAGANAPEDLIPIMKQGKGLLEDLEE